MKVPVSEAQSMMQEVSKEYISNRGTLNRILGDEELPVCSGMGVRFLWEGWGSWNGKMQNCPQDPIR